MTGATVTRRRRLPGARVQGAPTLAEEIRAAGEWMPAGETPRAGYASLGNGARKRRILRAGEGVSQ